jgi:hypothetical protein
LARRFLFCHSFDDARRQPEFTAPPDFHAPHFSSVGGMIVAQQVQDAVQQQNA